jgi:putative ABC transport system permease protein
MGRSFVSAQRATVAFQVAMSLALLVGASVALDGVRRLESQHLGMDVEGVLTATYQIPRWTVRDDSGRQAINAQVVKAVQSIPGVQVAGLASDLPVISAGEEVVFAPAGWADTPLPVARLYILSPGAFAALRMRVVRGRVPDDSSDSSLVVGETLAARYLSREGAIGGRLRHGVPGSRSPHLDAEAAQREIVGVVADIRRPGRPDESPLAIYVTERHVALERPHIVVRTQGDPTALASILQTRLREVIPDALVEPPHLLDTAVRSTLLLQHLYSRGFSAFALMALGMAAVGLWGITAYTVSLRRSEVAVRRALGASDSLIVRMLVRSAVTSVVPGLTLGSTIAWGLSQVLRSNVPGLGTAGTGASLVAVLAFVIVACGASYLPARRALRIEPTEALRTE